MPAKSKAKTKADLLLELATAIARIDKLTAELETARQRNPPAAPPPAELAAMPPPPADPLQAQVYAYQMLVLSMHNTAMDPKISDRERRKELRTTAASIAKLVPRARLAQAEQMILEDRRELEQKALEKRGAKLEKRPGVNGQKPKS